MNIKKPVNVFNGLKSTILSQNIEKPKSNLVAINVYQNSRNITKTIVKPISKII